MHRTLGILLLLLTGCTAVEKSPYPTDWPQPLSTQGCDAVSGRYESRVSWATYTHPHGEILLGLSLLQTQPLVHRVKSVEIDLGPDTLTITGYGETGELLLHQSYNHESGVYHCENGMLVIDPERMDQSETAPDSPLFGVSSGGLELLRTEDGSLVMRKWGSATGMAYLLVPVHAESEQWYRFRALPKP